MVKPCTWRCAASLLLTLFLASWSARAWAAAVTMTGSGLSIEFIISTVFSLVGALITGYIRGVDKHLERVEKAAQARADALEIEHRQQQQQINLLREKFHEEHPSRRETEEHRKAVESSLENVKDMFVRLESRLDRVLVNGPRRRSGENDTH